jgi:hypothetical protein
MATAYRRGFLETGISSFRKAGKMDVAAAAFSPVHAALALWAMVNGFADEATTDEMLILAASLGTVPAQLWEDIEGAAEGAVALLWALGYLEEMPAYDWRPDLPPIAQHVPVMGDATGFVEQASLRSRVEIEKARTLAEIWHWRADTTRILMERPNEASVSNWYRREVLALTAQWAAEGSDASALIEGDMPAFGKSYAALTEDEWWHCYMLAIERHRAVNWLCGYDEAWDDVPIDVMGSEPEEAR